MSETPHPEPAKGDENDQDAGPATTPDDVDRMNDRDQAEGEPEQA